MQRFSFWGVVTALAGVALLIVVVRQVGVAEIAADVRRVGWGIVLIIAIGGGRFLARAAAWRLCFETPSSLSLGDAFRAVIGGDALGNVTPLGPLVGEPAKAALVRGRAPLGAAVTALAIENVLYTLSAAAMIAAGMAALLLRFELPAAVRGLGLASLAATALLFAVALVLLWRQPALVSRALHAVPPLRRHAARARTLESEIYTFASRHRAAVPALAAAEIGFHALGVAEAYLTLWLLSGAAPPLLTAFLLETANRLIAVLFKVVPLRIGVDEAATGFLAQQVLGLGARTGISTAVVRRIRVLFWAILGGLVLVRQGVSPGTLRAPSPDPESRSNPKDRLSG